MAEEISTFQKFFRSRLLAVAQVSAAVGDGIFNAIPGPKAILPYLVFNVVPLEDAVGQARQSSMTRLLVDLKFVSGLPPAPAIHTAIKAFREDTRQSLSVEFEGYRISVRHERPIFVPEFGATPGEGLLNLGSTYRVWMTELP